MLSFRSKTGPSSLLAPWFELLDRDKKKWETYKKRAAGPRILLPTSVGSLFPMTTMDSLLAVALTIRGAKVSLLLCDKALSACEESMVHHFKNEERFLEYGPEKDLCKSCFASGEETYTPLRLPILKLSDWITKDLKTLAHDLVEKITPREIQAFEWDGLKIGEHAYAGALRFYGRGTIDGEKNGEGILKRYLKASLYTAFGIKTIMRETPFESASFHHGIYVPQGVIGEVFRKLNVHVVNWCIAYRKKCFIFSHNETYHRTLLNEPVSSWENEPFGEKEETNITTYLQSRSVGTNDWIWFHDKPHFEMDKFREKTGWDPKKPTIGLLTNVFWDAQLHYAKNCFENMLEWVIETIRYFIDREDLQLIIRIHPAEIRGSVPSRQPIAAEIRKVFEKLPKHIFIIEPDDPLSTYALMRSFHTALIYATKTGLELTSTGIPVIVAGEAWIRNKGVTLDATSKDQYFSFLKKLPEKLYEVDIRRAKQYANHFFFRRMIPISFIEPLPSWPPFTLKVESLDDLQEGNDRGLDTICNGILNKTPFIYD